MLSHFSCVRLFVTLWIVALQAPLSMGFFWSGLPCPPSGDLPGPEIKTHDSYVCCIGKWVLYH